MYVARLITRAKMARASGPNWNLFRSATKTTRVVVGRTDWAAPKGRLKKQGGRARPDGIEQEMSRQMKRHKAMQALTEGPADAINFILVWLAVTRVGCAPPGV